MKKIAVLAVACSVLAGCSYLGEPESYTVVDEVTTPVAEPAPAPAPMPVPVVAPMMVRPVAACGCCTQTNVCGTGACQINPGVAGPLVINIPPQTVCVQ